MERRQHHVKKKNLFLRGRQALYSRSIRVHSQTSEPCLTSKDFPQESQIGNTTIPSIDVSRQESVPGLSASDWETMTSKERYQAAKNKLEQAMKCRKEWSYFRHQPMDQHMLVDLLIIFENLNNQKRGEKPAQWERGKAVIEGVFKTLLDLHHLYHGVIAAASDYVISLPFTFVDV